ncbi:MAG: PAS domain S-box protein, partial [Rhodanobacter sp.]
MQKPLTQRLLPLAYALAVAIGLIMALTWGVLQVQVTLAGFLNSESVWSKAQKQAVIDLDNYAMTGATTDLMSFQDNYGLLESDRWGRDAIIAGKYSQEDIAQVFKRGNIMPAARPGITLMLKYFYGMPHLREALAAWRSTDAPIAELGSIANELQEAYRVGQPTQVYILRQRDRINILNVFMAPRTELFSVEVVNGALWLGQLLFWGMLGAFLIAALLWLRMARRILDGIRGSEERYRLLFDSAADAIVMIDESTGRILDVNRTTSHWTGRSVETLVGDRFVHLFVQSMLADQAGRAATNLLLGERGSTRPVELQTSLANWGSQTVRQAIIRDISDRVRMEQERRVAAEALAGIAEGVIIADPERRVISSNEAHAGLTGFSGTALLGRQLDEHRHLPDGRRLPKSIWDSVAAGKNWNGEVLSTRSDGSSYPEHLSISAIRDADGQPQYY